MAVFGIRKRNSRVKKYDSVLRFDARGVAPLRVESDSSFDKYDPSGSNVFTQAQSYRKDVVAYACINKRAGLGSAIPVRVVNSEGVVSSWANHPFILNQSEWLTAAIAYRLVFGAAYFAKTSNRFGYPASIELLSPLFCTPDINYADMTLRGIHYRRGGRVSYFKRKDLIVSTMFNLGIEEVDPLSPLEVAFRQISIGINVGDFARAFFANNASPSGLLTYDGGLTEEESREARTYWQKLFGGVRNAFKTAIMGGANGKWTWQKVSPDPVDLGMKEITDEAAMKICATFGVPPVLIGIGQASDPLSAQGTIDALNRQLIISVAKPDVQLILDDLNRQWMQTDFQEKWWLELDVSKYVGEGLSSEDRAITARGNFSSGLWSLNEARDFIGSKKDDNSIQRDPTAALNLFSMGVVTRNEVRKVVGYSPLAQDGFIWELDPRMTAPVNMPITMSGGNTPLPPVPIIDPEDTPPDIPPPPVNMGGNNEDSLNIRPEQSDNRTNEQPDERPDNRTNEQPDERYSDTEIENILDPLWAAACKRELDNWKDKARKNITSVFVSEILPPNLIATIKGLLTSGIPVVDVFWQARELLPSELQKASISTQFARYVIGKKKKEPDNSTVIDPQNNRSKSDINMNDPENEIVTEAAYYMENYDRAQAEIGEKWVEDYMNLIGARLLAWLKDTETIKIEQITDKFDELSADLTPELMQSWVGDKENKGALYKIALAGVMNGQKMLERSGISTNFVRENPDGVNLFWDLLNDETMALLKKYCPLLIKGIDATTKEILVVTIKKWMEEGAPMSALVERLRPIFSNEARAQQIASTETTRLYFEGSELRWKNSGVNKMIWQTSRDGFVCPICSKLHGKVTPVGETWDIGIRVSGQTENFRPPAHPGCRCGAKPMKE